ncbi:hypothetical protein BDA96_02G060600 [Sorghum bicolor]|uniref:F-box domain-containing protein n=2 Tax=Sorghum bicolor TaxID=4558 RepID=A0A921RLQ1_SORBI|nr:uncharacterized protein LOC8075037 [Sorghum bicolor]KAG0541953.1 hypothetical protein BDA96_02G060600 [Sorghum bicolor]OQU88598.1 hypothetical protein SORBI_3002G060400 [Sorghum bicolor]|eukprot:XP_002461586.1 uncharacterized protein LOC8075037 [Sorghum bicolor]
MDCPKTREAEAVAGLPDDPLVEILSRVPVKSLCCCKCVSKAWRDLIADPLNRKKLPQTLEGFFFVVDGCDDNSDSDDRDGKGIGSDDGDGENRSDGGDSRISVHFIDVFGRPPRPVDHYFPFLTELPGTEEIMLLDGCNGLLLFGCRHGSGKPSNMSFIVCNPATEQWIAVPKPDKEWPYSSVHLVFDPASSSHFHLVEIENMVLFETVRIYSSNSEVWSPVKTDFGDLHIRYDLHRSAYANGMVYVVSYDGMNQILVMDVEGNTRKTIRAPLQKGNGFRLCYDYVGQSQGRLHLICHHVDLDLGYDEIPPENQSYELLICVLEDYDREEWVLKDTVSTLKLFGSISPGMTNDFEVVTIHPDYSLVFLIDQHYKDEVLVSYNMDSKEVCRLCTLGTGMSIFPYVPYFSELPALENKH